MKVIELFKEEYNKYDKDRHYVILSRLTLKRAIKELEKLESIRQIIQEGTDQCDLGSHASAYMHDIKKVLNDMED